MDIDDILEMIHNHLDQSFDKVNIDFTDEYGDLTITAIKDGKSATCEVSISQFEIDEDMDDDDECENIPENLDNLKYELLKNII